MVQVVLATAEHMMDGWSGRSPSTAEKKAEKNQREKANQEILKGRAIALYKVGSRQRKEKITTNGITTEQFYPELKCMLSGEWLPYEEVRCVHLLPKKKTSATTMLMLGLPAGSLNEPRNTNLWAEMIEMAFDAKELCFEPVPLRTNQLRCRILDPTLNLKPISTSSVVLMSQMEGKILELPEQKKDDKLTRRPFMRVLAFHYECAMKAALLEGWISSEEYESRQSYQNWSPECKSSFLQLESEVSSLSVAVRESLKQG